MNSTDGGNAPIGRTALIVRIVGGSGGGIPEAATDADRPTGSDTSEQCTAIERFHTRC